MIPTKVPPNGLDPKKFYISGIKRPGFQRESPLPRQVDFDALELLDINLYGEKVQLSKKTLDELMTVTLPDPDDKTYKMEGRPQRTVKVKYNLAEIGKSAADVSTKLEVIKQAIDQNRISTTTEVQNLRSALIEIIKANPGVMQNQPSGSLPIIQQAVQHSGVPKVWNEPGSKFQSRFYSKANLNSPDDDRTYLFMYLIDNVPVGRTISTPVLDEATIPPGSVPILIAASKAIDLLEQHGDFVIDLETRSLERSTNLAQTPAQSIATQVQTPPYQPTPPPQPSPSQAPPPPPPTFAESTDPVIRDLEKKLAKARQTVEQLEQADLTIMSDFDRDEHEEELIRAQHNLINIRKQLERASKKKSTVKVGEQAGAVALQARKLQVKQALKTINDITIQGQLMNKAVSEIIAILQKGLNDPTVDISSEVRSLSDVYNEESKTASNKQEYKDVIIVIRKEILPVLSQRGLGKKKRVRIYKF